METLASPRRLIELLGGMYSRELGIDLPEAPCDQLPDAGNLPQAPAARYPGLAWEPARSL